jgi:hypothetical protein
MKVLNPLNTEHEIILIPRVYPVGNITLNLYNEESDEILTYEIMPLITDGLMYLSFTETFINKSNYRIVILDDTDIIYRGKLFITDQTDLENYKITKDIFTL